MDWASPLILVQWRILLSPNLDPVGKEMHHALGSVPHRGATLLKISKWSAVWWGLRGIGGKLGIGLHAVGMHGWEER